MERPVVDEGVDLSLGDRGRGRGFRVESLVDGFGQVPLDRGLAGRARFGGDAVLRVVQLPV